VIDFPEPLPPSDLDKPGLRERTGDEEMVTEFCRLHEQLKQIELSEEAVPPNQLQKIQRNPTANLPARLISAMQDIDALSRMAQAMDTQADKIMKIYESFVSKHEVYFLLGLISVHVSSRYGLGYHNGSANQSFVRFQLMAIYCLAKCIEESKQSAAEGRPGLSDDQSAFILKGLITAYRTSTCTETISRQFAVRTPAYMKPLLERVLKIGRFASTGE